MTRIAVIDFETSGSTPGQGARATEIAIVMVDGGEVTGSFQSLMNGGVWIPPFIAQLTGITNAMVESAPQAREVMRKAHDFVAGAPMVAHNAPFDQGFWRAEMGLAGLDAPHLFACTVRLSRRLYPNAPNHRLGTLVEYHGIDSAGPAHRAMADASVTAQMLLRMQTHLRLHWDIEAPDHGFLVALQACAKARLSDFLVRHSRGGRTNAVARSDGTPDVRTADGSACEAPFKPPHAYARTNVSNRPL